MSTPGQQYLDLTWDYYQTNMVSRAVDIWNTHLYILGRIRYSTHGQGDGRIAFRYRPSIAKRAYYAPYGSPQKNVLR